MRQSFSRWSLILILCLGSALLLSGCTGEKRESSVAPDFTLKTLQGQEITLSKLKGQVVLLDFWATWCGPCKESIPHLVHLYKANEPKGLQVIGMNMDRGDENAVRRFVQSMDIPYPVVLTPEQVARDFGAVGLPTTVLVDKQGKIRAKIPGFSLKIGQTITATVEELLSEKP